MSKPLTSDVEESPAAARPVRVDSTLSKGLQILEALSKSPNGKGVSDLSRELGLTKSNTFRLLQTLTTLGYVRNSASKLYSASMKVWQVGQAVVEHLDLPKIAAPQLQMLSRKTGEAVYLAVPDGLSIIYVEKIESMQPIRSFTPKGGSAPMHCVGTGKALLAANYETLRPQIRDHLVKYTDKTITSIKQLDADMAATRARGYAIDTGEFRERILSFGAAIRLPNGEPVAALGVSAPDVNLAAGRDEEIAALVLQAAQEVSLSLQEV
ncbi:MAG: IclR family transcriptional regulator [Rhodospirillales bacterium]